MTQVLQTPTESLELIENLDFSPAYICEVEESWPTGEVFPCGNKAQYSIEIHHCQPYGLLVCLKCFNFPRWMCRICGERTDHPRDWITNIKPL